MNVESLQVREALAFGKCIEADPVCSAKFKRFQFRASIVCVDRGQDRLYFGRGLPLNRTRNLQVLAQLKPLTIEERFKVRNRNVATGQDKFLDDIQRPLLGDSGERLSGHLCVSQFEILELVQRQLAEAIDLGGGQLFFDV